MMKTKRERKIAKLKAAENKLSQIPSHVLYKEIISRIQEACEGMGLEDQTYCIFGNRNELKTVQPNIVWINVEEEGGEIE
jgi:hypothetical protein